MSGMIDNPNAFDVAVVGGGIMGCITALHLARAGMRAVILERRGLCMEATGVNAGTLSIQIKNVDVIPHSMRGWELWKTMPDWLGVDIGFHQLGGLTLAFDEDDAEILRARARERIDQGAPIKIVSAARAREIEPALSDRVVLASYCPMDGFAHTYELGRPLRRCLAQAGVDLREFTPVDAIEVNGRGYTILAGATRVRATRLVIATGAWLGRTCAMLGVRFPIGYRVNQVHVTARMPVTFRTILGVARDPMNVRGGSVLGTSMVGTLTLKQSDNGSVLIGGGWQGLGDLDQGAFAVRAESMIGNIRQAAFAIPALRDARVIRGWCGLEGHTADFKPLAGRLPKHNDAFVVGCCRGGFTIGPCMGKLMADLILDREPELPLFDPGRFTATDAGA